MPAKGHMPDVAIFHTPGCPIIRFEILDIYFTSATVIPPGCPIIRFEILDIYFTSATVILSEGLLTEDEYEAFIHPHDCIVMVLGSKIETTKGQLTWGDFK